MWQVGLLIRAHARGRHDHAGGAEAALEGLGVVEGLLDRVHLPGGSEPLDGRDLAPFGAKRGYEAGMEGLAINPHGAGPAVARVAALLDAEDLEVAEEGAEALPGFGLRREEVPVDFVSAHASSARICSAK